MTRSVPRFALALPVLAVLAGGCRGGSPDPVPVSSPTVAVPVSSPTVAVPVSSPTVAPVAGPVAFHVRLGAGQTLTTEAAGSNDCPGLDAVISVGRDAQVRLTAFGAQCAAGENGSPGNGRHGVYRTTADIPADRRAGAVTVPTALGEATVFNQPYYECTNSCKHYTEPVAVITLAHPDQPGYATLTACAERGSIGLDRLTALLRDQLTA